MTLSSKLFLTLIVIIATAINVYSVLEKAQLIEIEGDRLVPANIGLFLTLGIMIFMYRIISKSQFTSAYKTFLYLFVLFLHPIGSLFIIWKVIPRKKIKAF